MASTDGATRARARARMRLLLILAPLAVLAAAGAGSAHEFWLEPHDAHLAPGDRLVADTMVGQMFEGEILGYDPKATVHLDLTRGDESRPLIGVLGQVPAVDMPPLGDGLNILRFQSANREVTYETFAEFAEFAEEWGQDWALEAHAANGFPTRDIREVYFRYAKALIGVGDGEGQDRALDMPLELVALTNPYAEPAPEAVRLELRFLGEPLAGGSVKVFHRAPDGAVEVTHLETDADGMVSVPTAPGFTLVNAVVLDLASPRMQMFLGASWQSLWASITYHIESPTISSRLVAPIAAALLLAGLIGGALAQRRWARRAPSSSRPSSKTP